MVSGVAVLVTVRWRQTSRFIALTTYHPLKTAKMTNAANYFL